MFQFLTGSRFHFYVGPMRLTIIRIKTSFNSLQEVGFISTWAGRYPALRGSCRFQFLTGSRFHFYWAAMLRALQPIFKVSIPYRK